jgi:hypothetical protein
MLDIFQNGVARSRFLWKNKETREELDLDLSVAVFSVYFTRLSSQGRTRAPKTSIGRVFAVTAVKSRD